jgi:hypothetical protein
MNATTLIHAAMLVLPALAGNDQQCTVGYSCECYFDGTTDRCAVPGIDRGIVKVCTCPDFYHGAKFLVSDCINVGEYNDRHHCRYVQRYILLQRLTNRYLLLWLNARRSEQPKTDK